MKTVPYLGILLLAGLLAYFLRFGHLELGSSYLLALLSVLLASSILLPATGAMREGFRNSLARRSRRMLAGWALVMTSMVALSAMLKVTAIYSRVWFGYWVLLGAFGLAALQILEYLWRVKIRRRHGPMRKLVLVGAGPPLERVSEQLKGEEGSGFQVLETFSLGQSVDAGNALAGLARIVEVNAVDDVWIALPLDRPELLDAALSALSRSLVDVHVIPDFEHYRLLNQGVSEWAGLPFISLSNTPMSGSELMLKAALDRAGAFILLLFLSPLMLFISAGVLFSGPGPVLFRQKRHGIGGEVIHVLKFRTMHLHREPEGRVVQASENDERITWFGRFLRRTSLDELPQLVNVLLGQMSLVGPRPHALEHNSLFQERIPRYMLRHKVKPGMTGWAQVNGLRGLTESDEKMALRIEYDLWYIRNWSIWLDLTILLRTPFVMVHRNAY